MSASGLRLGAVDTELPTPAALADATANPTSPIAGAAGLVWNGSTWDRARGAGVGDAAPTTGLQAVVQAAMVSAAAADRLRTPNKFVSGFANVTVGTTALWTPAAGKKFRLMRFLLQLSGNATLAAAGVLTVNLMDGAANLGFAVDLFIPNASANVLGGWTSGWVDLGNGYLSAAANNVLGVNLPGALTNGDLRCNFAGTEE